jgi:predicted heme/steroid binding protein
MNKSIFVFILMILALPPLYASATPEYSGRTSQGCRTCHIKAEGGALTDTGLQYAASGYTWPPVGGFRALSPIKKSVRLLIGLFHITASFLWFGTILYVHILLRPAYASKGLPRGEVILGIASMFVVGLTGALLTISRIGSISVLFNSQWGIVLSIKIAIYIAMVTSAFIVVAFIGPHLKRTRNEAGLPKGGVFNAQSLSGFDGRDGRPAFVAYKGIVYDMTGVKLWKGGMHIKHSSGEDLTSALQKAPHGEEKLEGLKAVGSFDASFRPPMETPQKAFYFIAYMNLALVFAVLIAIAFWRWGL